MSTVFKKYARIWLVTTLILTPFLGSVSVKAANTGSVSVEMTVPSANSGGGGGGGGGGAGAPPAPADSAPTINAVNYVVKTTSTTVAWSASDDKGISSSVFDYGLTTDYGKKGTITGTYQVILLDLATSTKYFFKITVTDTAKQTAVYTGSFTTAANPVVVLPVITALKVVTQSTTTIISWNTDVDTMSEVDFGLTVDYGSQKIDESFFSTHALTLAKLFPNTTYHYRVIATDKNGNSQTSADSTFTTLKEQLPPPDVSRFQAVPVGKSIVLGWQNPSALAAPDFKEVRIIKKIGSRPATINDGELIYSGNEEQVVDKNVQVNVSYYYSAFTVDTSDNLSAGTFARAEVPPLVGQEICTNEIDDDLNGAIDCVDKACSLSASCLLSRPVPEAGSSATSSKPSVPSQPGAEGENPTSTPAVPQPATPAGELPAGVTKVTLDNVQFLAANRQVQLVPNGATITNLSGFNFSVALPRGVFTELPASIVLTVSGQGVHQLRYDSVLQRYITDVVFPPVGTYPSFITIEYGKGQTDSIAFTLISEARGKVAADKNKAPLPGVVVKLFHEDGTPVDPALYGENGDFTTAPDGQFGWVLPKGKYYATFSLPGYYQFSTPLFDVTDNVFNPSIELVPKPKKLSEVVDFNKSLGENLQNITKNLSDQAGAAAKLLQNLSNDPQVEKAVETVVAPTAVSVAAASSVPLIPWGDIFPLLRLLFFQPVLLIGKRKREGWGQVYNSLTKLPIDLAIVRLVDAATGKVVQSRVTDKNGRYYFTVNPGKYRLEVVKDKMSFPSKLLQHYTEDGRRPDIYHGELVLVNEKYPAITANVPLDPVGDVKPPHRLKLEKLGRGVQSVLSSLGLVVTAASFYVSPKWYVGALLAGHLVITFVFHRLAKPPKPKSWGIVYDHSTKSPIGRAVVRLFNAQFNKLIATQITDNKGRYYFLAGDNKFYVTYDHKDYASLKSEDIDLGGKEVDTIRNNVGLKKKTAL